MRKWLPHWAESGGTEMGGASTADVNFGALEQVRGGELFFGNKREQLEKDTRLGIGRP